VKNLRSHDLRLTFGGHLLHRHILRFSYVCGNICRYQDAIGRRNAVYTDKKENQIFLIYKEIQSGAVAKSYMKKGFLIYEEIRKYFPYMMRPLVIYD
jgi:hypothetical protein